MRTKERRKPVARVDPTLEYRRRLKGVLDALRVRSLFEALPVAIRDQMTRRQSPEPTLAFDASCPNDAEFTRLRATLTKAFCAAKIDADDGTSMRVVDFFSILPWVAAATAHADPGAGRVPPACTRFFEAMRPRATAWQKLIDGAWLAWHEAVVAPLAERSRLDGRLFNASIVGTRTPTGGQAITMLIRAVPAQMARATLDGESRPTYRVGSCNEWDGVQWTSWTGATLGRADAERELPVYAQSHALRQLRSRIDLPTYAPWLEYWMHHSMKTPTIVERQANGDLLVAYCVSGLRLGYLIVTPLSDRVVVRTFLFLTMTPSPEARQLERQLRLRRDDVNWLGLNELSAFTRTDLIDAETLRPMLDACGCGHLFELHDFDPSPSSRAVASEMKKYLRMAA